MRKITKLAVQAFINDKKFNQGNTVVIIEENTAILSLHGNHIAYKDKDGNIEIANRGYFTNTTKERLNGIPGVNIQQKDWQWYLNGNLWNGNLIKIQ